MGFNRIVVTGGTGFLGRQVVGACRDAGFEVRSCSRSEGVDLGDGAAWGHWLGTNPTDCVVHCAAHVGGLGYVRSNSIEVFHDNLEIAGGLMRGIHAAGVSRLITVMPNCTYPGDKSLYKEEEWWDGPIHDSVLMYGLPRKMLWGLCETYADATGLQSAHLIFPNLYGPGDHCDPLRSHALGALVSKITGAHQDQAPTVELWGSGEPVREWMFVQDAADAIVCFLRKVRDDDSVLANNSIYNVGIGRGISIAELAELIRQAVGWEGSFVFDTFRPDGARQKLLDGRRFGGLTGWEPTVPLRAGIERTVTWYRSNVESELANVH